MAPKKFDSDEAINEQYSRFKIWFSFKDKRNKTFYAKEKNATYRQIGSGRVQSVTFNHQQGFENLVYLAETYYAGKYITAIIYDRLYPDTIIRKYVQGILQPGSVEVEFTAQSKCTNYFVKERNGSYALVPAANEIDFKKEIESNLSKSI